MTYQNQNNMKDLFYSVKDKKLFWVAGYANEINVKSLISTLTNNYNYFYKICKVKEINTDVLRKSRKYKDMRVYWCDTETIPEEAFVIKNDYWDMWKWLEN